MQHVLIEIQSLGDVALMYSVVTHQELLGWCAKTGRDGAMRRFLHDNFNPPMRYGQAEADEAVRIASITEMPKRKEQQSNRAYDIAKDVWHRDLAILGTAKHHNAFAVVTADVGMLDYASAIEPTRIIILQPIALPVGDAAKA